MTDSFITLLVGADNMPAHDTHTDDWDASDWEVADFADEGEDLSLSTAVFLPPPQWRRAELLTCGIRWPSTAAGSTVAESTRITDERAEWFADPSTRRFTWDPRL